MRDELKCSTACVGFHWMKKLASIVRFESQSVKEMAVVQAMDHRRQLLFDFIRNDFQRRIRTIS